MGIINGEGRTCNVPCSSNMREDIFERVQMPESALLWRPSTFWVISRVQCDVYCKAAMAKCVVLGDASRTGGYPRYERSLMIVCSTSCIVSIQRKY